MADPFASNSAGLSSPAYRHFAITPANEDLAIRPRAIYVDGDGALVMRDDTGTDITYAVVAGQILPFRAVQVRSGTTATVIGWY
jgi:hypothetical protein